MMAWIDLNAVHIANPYALSLLGLTLLLGFAALVVPWRHAKRSVAVAGMLRCCVIGLLVFALAGFVVVTEQELRFEPQGTWALVLPGATPVVNGATVVFRETDGEFVNRVRAALADGTPPAATQVYGPKDQAIAARDALLAMGMPARAIYPPDGLTSNAPLITGIRAPRAVKPGEPFKVEFATAGPVATMTVTLDGEPLPLDGTSVEIRTDTPGRHVIEAVLTDAAGTELQRVGHVFRVGEWPRVLSIGLDDKQLNKAAVMLPDMRIRNVAPESFRAADLRHEEAPVDLALTSVDALNHLSNEQATALAMFVARGGGLMITGDGAKYVAPEFLARDARNLLPVLLQKEGRKPPPEDPTVEEQPIKAEIAKVSMCFVLDRSYSMNATIGNSKTRRWNVAMQGVTESLALVDQGGRRDATDRSSEAYATRIGVMTFNLEQHWLFGMRAALKFDRDEIGRNLQRVGDEIVQVRREDFDAQGYNTDIYAAMKNAIEVMKKEKSAVKVIVMLTDGADRDANTQAGLKHSDLREIAIANDINIITIGIGDAFDNTSTEGPAALRVIEDLATRNEFKHVARDDASATKAHVIFVDSVETAFQAYDDKKKKEEDDRRAKQDENKEEPKVDVMPGTWPLSLTAAGEQLFGRDALPTPAPKVGWVARNLARDGAAVALAAETEEGAVPTLVFSGYGLGRVGFWGAGTDPEALGELTGWAEFPGLFAGSMRWLLPREEPDVRLLAEATPEGVRILDALEHAEYVLKTADGEIPLRLAEGLLVADQPLPPGAAEVIERVQSGGEALERSIGDVFVADTPAADARQTPVDAAPELPPLTTRSPEVTTFTREAVTPMLYLLLAALLIMPIERLVRRRS